MVAAAAAVATVLIADVCVDLKSLLGNCHGSVAGPHNLLEPFEVTIIGIQEKKTSINSHCIEIMMQSLEEKEADLNSDSFSHI